VLLLVFVVIATITGNGSTAWTVVQWFGVPVSGIIALLVVVSLVLERRSPSSDGKEE
jgi:hypothetical protein